MRGIRAVLIAVIVLGLAGAAGAAGPRTLTRAGDLYAVAMVDNQAVVTARHADGTLSELAVPQTAGIEPDSLQVGVDPATGALYVLWQKSTDMEARVRIATYVDGTWLGPITVAGNDGTAAVYPQMMVQRVVSTYSQEPELDEEPAEVEIATTFIHLVWWSRVNDDDVGTAKYMALPVRDDGVPLLRDAEQSALVDFLPYGVACFDIAGGDELKHPKLLVDPVSGNPHVFATDFGDCLFQIIELQAETVADESAPGKRRRQIIILRNPSMIALRPDVPLGRTKIEVGRGLDIFLHWDGDEGDRLHYLELDPEGASTIKSLELGEDLSHEQAVDLIRGLIN
jgi:hypothetical protein